VGDFVRHLHREKLGIGTITEIFISETPGQEGEWLTVLWSRRTNQFSAPIERYRYELRADLTRRGTAHRVRFGEGENNG
jgi:hypothetical protein